jgi:hypothetical protein
VVTVAVVAAGCAAAVVAPPGSTVDRASSPVSVIFAARDGMDAAADSAVRRAGGRVTQRLALIGGQVAVVPAASVGRLATDPAVAWVTPNRPVRLDAHELG